MDIPVLPTRLAKIALLLADTGALDDVCAALENSRLQSNSTAAVRATLTGGNSASEAHIRVLQDIWRDEGSALYGSTIALALRAIAAAVEECRRHQTITQVVWTGPKVEGSFLRSTREVVREVLRGAHRDLLVIGYWITANYEGEGIIEEIIASLGEAVRRGVTVNVVVDERERKDGQNNRRVFLEAWPAGVPLPSMFTWRLPTDDHYVKLHAKVLVADGEDALVTSANLTFYAMERNMEMGVRVTGAPASLIAEHFHRLIDTGVLNQF